ncbi:MAG: sulfatase, partial [Gemmatimonadales bacterium]
YWWLTPLVLAALLALVTTLLVLAVPGRFARFRVRLGFGIPIALGTLGVLLTFPAISPAAAALLALAAGVRLAVWLSRHEAGFSRLARVTLPFLLLAPLLGGIVRHGRPWVRSLGLAAFGPRVEGPNVLLIILDTVRAIELGLYGGPSPSISPNLDGFAAEGVVFDKAFSAAPWTGPSHASIFTGRRAAELSIDWDRTLDGRFPTLAGELRRAGYATMGVVANTRYAGAATGLARGFDWYEDSRLTLEAALLQPRLARQAVQTWRRLAGEPPVEPVPRISAQEVTRRFLTWAGRRPGRPYFAFLNYYDAHAPYTAPEPFWSRHLPGVAPEALPGPPTLSPVMVMLRRRAYDAAIAYLDSELGRLFEALTRGGMLENTLVIVTADHGEEFLEHGLMGHGQSLYTQAVRVPLVAVWPGRLPRGVRVAEPVSLERLPATIFDLAGKHGAFAGPSLAGLWRGENPGLPPLAIHSSVSAMRRPTPDYPRRQGAIASVQIGTRRYIERSGDSVGQLFDHATDPAETRNLLASAGRIDLKPWCDSLSLRRAPAGARTCR